MFAWSTLPSFLTVLSFKTSINYVRRDQNTLTKQEDICRLSFCRLTWLPNWRGLQKSPGLCSHRAGKGAGRGLVPWSSTVPQRQNWGPEPSHLDWQLSVLLTCELFKWTRGVSVFLVSHHTVHLSWMQAIPFCLLFAERCIGTFLADRKRPNELLAELINRC